MTSHLKTTFGIDFPADVFGIRSKEDIIQFFNTWKGSDLGELLVLGGGSNMIVSPDKVRTVLKIEIPGLEVVREGDNSVQVEVGAGEIMDELVEKVLDAGFSGVEVLSAIPGTVGGAIVQNAGAYGTEVKDVLESVEVYDVLKREFRIMNNTECEFAYRNSFFKKNENKKRYIITSVRFNLQKSTIVSIPEYKDIKNKFTELGYVGGDRVESNLVRNVITEVRWSKLPKPEILANVGSFFHNPVLSQEDLDYLKVILPEVPSFKVDDGGLRYKVPAGYLLEQCGLKGYREGDVGLYEKHALVMVNHGSASFEDVLCFIEFIKDKVRQLYGVELTVEPEIV